MKKSTRGVLERLVKAVENLGACDVEGHDQPCGCELDAAAEVARWVLDDKYGYGDPVEEKSGG